MSPSHHDNPTRVENITVIVVSEPEDQPHPSNKTPLRLICALIEKDGKITFLTLQWSTPSDNESQVSARDRNAEMPRAESPASELTHIKIGDRVTISGHLHHEEGVGEWQKNVIQVDSIAGKKIN